MVLLLLLFLKKSIVSKRSVIGEGTVILHNATVNAISYLNAVPVFCDVDEDTMELSPFVVRKWLEENAEVKNVACYNKSTGRKISVVVPMHTFGHPVHLDDFVKLCQEWKLALVEDAAESIGSFYKGNILVFSEKLLLSVLMVIRLLPQVVEECFFLQIKILVKRQSTLQLRRRFLIAGNSNMM